MDNRIDRPPELTGDYKTQITAIWRYLIGLAEKLNFRLDGIGSNELTDPERQVIQKILEENGNTEKNRQITMKDMIIAVAQHALKDD